MQKARAGMSVSEETVALYGAARAFLIGEWIGALLMLSSFTLLYLLYAATAWSPKSILIATLGLMGVGTVAYLRSRAYYQRIAFPYAPRAHLGALLVAGSAVVFWLLFALLEILVGLGVEVGG
jgi:hypothetical protein